MGEAKSVRVMGHRHAISRPSSYPPRDSNFQLRSGIPPSPVGASHPPRGRVLRAVTYRL